MGWISWKGLSEGELEYRYLARHKFIKTKQSQGRHHGLAPPALCSIDTIKALDEQHVFV
jgi:hypothetical protein